MRTRPAFAVLMLVVLLIPGCIDTEEDALGGVGTYDVNATWTTIELETKTAFYADDDLSLIHISEPTRPY